jgi:hypothetical protein
VLTKNRRFSKILNCFQFKIKKEDETQAQKTFLTQISLKNEFFAIFGMKWHESISIRHESARIRIDIFSCQLNFSLKE